jgi:uncharacterized C2H2 Zn-finger protein
MTRTTLICQVPGCGKEYHDIAEYYEHVNSHEQLKGGKKRENEQ